MKKDELHGICPITKCALKMLSRNSWLRKENLIIEDKNCGCPDCIKRANQIKRNQDKIIKVGELF